MRRFLALFATIVAPILLTTDLRTACGVDPIAVYKESFEGGLHVDWKIIREDKTHRSFEKKPGQLTITTQRGTIHGDEETDALSEGRKAKNIFLLDKPIPDDADFDAILAVTSFKPLANYHQVALIFYKDDDNYVKWSMEHSWRDPGSNNLILVRESESVPNHALIEKKEAKEKFWLKIARSGDQYVCSFSEDGKDYELIGLKEWATDAQLDESRIGFLAKNGGDPKAEEIEAVIDSFELKLYAPRKPTK